MKPLLVMRDLRLARRETQTDVGHVVACSQTIISRIEGGNFTPAPEIRRALERHFGAPFGVLMLPVRHERRPYVDQRVLKRLDIIPQPCEVRTELVILEPTARR